VAAEETLIAVLLQHPDFIKTAREELSPQKMITDLNSRVYKTLLQADENRSSIDISIFAQSFSAGEVGYLVSLQNGNKAGNNAKTVLKDCIKVILEENAILNSDQNKDENLEDWASRLQEIINKKAKGKE
jgi:replicative DNA helicase